LERAEALLRKARLLPQAKHSSESSSQKPQDENPFDFSNLEVPLPRAGSALVSNDSFLPANEQLSALVNDSSFASGFVATNASPPLSTDYFDASYFLNEEQNEDDNSPDSPEAPPLDDFEWDERDLGIIEATSQSKFLWSSNDNGGDEENVIDGMASLTVDDRESGYLGIASGAALLRMMGALSPAPGSSRRPAWRRLSVTSPTLQQPSPNRHILDTMIDSYFRLFHLSYPLIHEPTFRAQYAEVIPRPNGNSWLVLAYVVAAIGVFTTSSSSENVDLALFGQAKLLLTIDFLESGNLSLLQALILSGNYIQKRNKPNSGYNYLGLAVRMAMGLGLHKEFEGWNISPLQMEIRRRVWWTLALFDIGATITYSRPMTWPALGTEVTLPMNLDDKVGYLAFALVSGKY
jgi:transcriptional regulatory protein GAL4